MQCNVNRVLVVSGAYFINSALEERVAKMMGKEAGLYVPSGTMGNLIGSECRYFYNMVP